MQNYQEQSPSPLRSLLSRLFDGNGAAPVPATIAPPMPAAPTDMQADAFEAQRNGPMNDANLPASIRNRMFRPRVAPAGTLGGMPIAEGQNANIDDDARARALAWAMRMNPNG